MDKRKLTYKGGVDVFKTAHTLRNCDMVKLFEFFNPEQNQGQITGSNPINNSNVPKFLSALGFEVKTNNETWHVTIPEEFRTMVITEHKRIYW